MAVDSTLQCFLACEEMELLGDFVPSAMSRRDVKSHLDSFNNFLAFDWKISLVALGLHKLRSCIKLVLESTLSFLTMSGG